MNIRFGIALGIAVCVLVAWWYTTNELSLPDNTSVTQANISINESGNNPLNALADSPFEVSKAPKPIPGASIESSADPLPANGLPGTLPAQSGITPDWYAARSEDELRDLVARLHQEPALLQQLIDQFRQETDPERKALLAGVLGEVAGDEVTVLASELIFSGDDASRVLGMDLLQDVQPGNAQARDIVSGMLSTEVEPVVLIDALTALAKPGDVDTQSRAFLSDQVAWLSTHQDDDVRSISMDILSRWSEDGRHTDTLLSGLDDRSEYVRASAAYALAKSNDGSPGVVTRLLDVVRTDDEQEPVRQAAIFALKSLSLTQTQQSELQTLETRLNTIKR